jgi:hypothetical protein
MLFDCSKEIKEFLDEKVKLSKDDMSDLKEYRDKNLTRLTNGLEKNGDPAYHKFINQGSDAMKTIIQHPDNDYDIDVGIIFKRDDLKGSQNADKTPLDSRKMVCEAMQDDRFNKAPKVLKNCVRVFYKEGHHVDMPVYRTYENENGRVILELAGSEWEESDPEAINRWFKEEKKRKSKLKDIVQLSKKWSKSRDSWNMPSGLIFTILLSENHTNHKRVDEVFYWSLKELRDRLNNDKKVCNPTNCDEITSSEKHLKKVEFLLEKLDDTLDNNLAILEEDSCSYEEAMKAWSKFFKDDFFKDKIPLKKETSTRESRAIVAPHQPWILF